MIMIDAEVYVHGRSMSPRHLTMRLAQHQGKVGVVISQIPGGYHGVRLDDSDTVIAHYSQLASAASCAPEEN